METAKRCGVSRMSEILTEIVGQTPQVLETVRGRIPNDFLESVANTILQGVRSSAEDLQAQARHGDHPPV